MAVKDPLSMTAMTLIPLALLLVGCATVPEVVATYDATGNVQTEPLREIVPKTDPDDPQVIGWENNPGSSMEGTVSFMKATAPDGTVVLDRVINGDADAQTLPPGSYTLSEYWRDCGGNCDFLGYARQVCSVEAVLAEGGRYRLTLGTRPADCTLTEL